MWLLVDPLRFCRLGPHLLLQLAKLDVDQTIALQDKESHILGETYIHYVINHLHSSNKENLQNKRADLDAKFVVRSVVP